MVLGLGTGSTAVHALDCIGDLLRRGSSTDSDPSEQNVLYDSDPSPITLKFLRFFPGASVEAIGQIEELLSEVRVIEFKGNHIRLLLKTPIPSLDILPLQYNSASFIEPAVVDHELMIEVLENNLEPMNLKRYMSELKERIARDGDPTKLPEAPVAPVVQDSKEGIIILTDFILQNHV
ncbi:hypothetical protein J5N97_020721 [Dioscorea zingiberensis]|uniref:Uncharacterized protein n=1 Tax=Dioscorea zingiberensis TaxID=325984 RepID=A0A9D5CHM7_9LILI|nr:hypothetical protein J5N97_020721 [Dioscorea zingiberensis]